MGVEPPFLYTPPNRYSAVDPYNGFNPKAVTQASYCYPPPKRTSRPASDRPLIENVNRHPDSYMIIPYGNNKATPMDPKVKERIKWIRWIQLALRCLLLLGVLGALFCAICIKGATDTEGWILRIPPGADIVVSIYAIYHLARPAKGRTPGSSASYHFFALVMDAGFIPFYVFIAMLSKTKAEQKTGTEGRWRSFFDNDSTNILLTATWLVAVSVGSLHLTSFFIDLYLTLVFRKIAKLPPDMNPLEDNLTRRSTKHKHKSSSLSNISTDKSASTVSLPRKGDSLVPEARSVPFIHTRQNSSTTFSPHNPLTASEARASMVDVSSRSMYQQPRSGRTSRVDVSSSSVHEQPRSVHASRVDVRVSEQSTAKSQKGSIVNGSLIGAPSFATSNRRSFVSNQPLPPLPQNASKLYSFASESAFATSHQGPEALNPRDSKQANNSNWEVLSNSDSSDIDSEDEQRHNGTVRRTRLQREYQAVPRYSFERSPSSEERELVPNPLRMHPPTPNSLSFQSAIGQAISTDDLPLASPSRTPKSHAAAVKGGSSVLSPQKVRKHGKTAEDGDAHYETQRERQSRAISRTGADIADAAERERMVSGEYSGWMGPGMRNRGPSGMV